jgi:hypothetical protein
MKTKKLVQKIIINKQTVANLENGQMNEVKGGFSGATDCTEPNHTKNCYFQDETVCLC